MKKILFLLALASTTALADPTAAALARCRAMSDVIVRLSCYDAIALPAQANASAQASASAAPAPVASAAVPAPFGLPTKANPDEPKSIQSTIPGRFEGWKARTRITLANGQVWQITDDSSGFCDCDNPKVTIYRRAFDGYWMEIEGKTHTPTVKRVK